MRALVAEDEETLAQSLEAAIRDMQRAVVASIGVTPL